MQFIAIEIASVPIDDDGYRYFLLIGDIFSKFIEAVPLIDQTSPSVLDGLSKRWILLHGSPMGTLFVLFATNRNREEKIIRLPQPG